MSKTPLMLLAPGVALVLLSLAAPCNALRVGVGSVLRGRHALAHCRMAELPVSAGSSLAELRAFVKSEGLDVKISGPGRTKAAIFEDVVRLWGSRRKASDAMEAGLKSNILDEASNQDMLAMWRDAKKLGTVDVGLMDAMLSRWLTPKSLVQLTDVNEDGVVTQQEFLDAFSVLELDKQRRSDALGFFKLFDRGGKGFMTPEEYEAMITTQIKMEQELMLAKQQAEWDFTDVREDTLLIGVVAHNEMKPSMIDFVAKHRDFFRKVQIVTTGSTGRTLEKKLGLKVSQKVQSGPLGGDQEIGAMVARGEVGGVFFFRDPLTSHPHASDIEALGRLCITHDVVTAENPSTGTAVVHAFKTSKYHMSRLYKLDGGAAVGDSTVVQKYKEGQDEVIQAAAASPSNQLR